MDTETELIEANRTTTLPDGSDIIYPNTNGLGDFQGTPQDANTNPSYIPSSWLNLINRFMGRLLLAKGVTPSSTITAAQLSSAVSPYWQVDGVYLAGDVKFHNGKQYICTAPHTATTANAPDQAGAPWVELELWQRDKMIPIGFIYLNKTDNTNPSALANPWPGNWATLSPDDYLAIQGGRYALNTQYSDGLPNITGVFDPDGWFGGSNRIEGTGPFRNELTTTEFAQDHSFDSNGMKINFDASRSNPIYGNANHVQPQTLGVAGFVKTAFAY